jgi:hypothetical protein
MHKASTKNVWRKRYKPLLTIIVILFSVCLLIACTGEEDSVDIDETEPNILLHATIFAVATMAALALIFFSVRAITLNMSKRKKAARMAKLQSMQRTASERKATPEPKSTTSVNKTVATTKTATSTSTMGFEFSGKLDLFVVKKSSRKPFPTMYKINANQTISLQELLDKCAMVVSIPGDKYIFFSFEHGILQVINNSERSFLVGNAELAENQSHNLVNGEAVVFSCGGGDNLVVSPRFLYQSRKRSSR